MSDWEDQEQGAGPNRETYETAEPFVLSMNCCWKKRQEMKGTRVIEIVGNPKTIFQTRLRFEILYSIYISNSTICYTLDTIPEFIQTDRAYTQHNTKHYN
jgi:hypothetical protein